MSKHALAVIGAGNALRNWLMPGINAFSDRVSIRYLLDTDTTKIPDLPGCNPLHIDNIQLAIQDPEVSGFIVQSPSQFHESHVISCAAANKPILCEKPLSENLEQALKIYDAVDEQNLLVGYMRFYQPQYQVWKQAVKDMHNVKYINIMQNEYPILQPECMSILGSVLKDILVHYVDLVIDWLDCFPKSVKATGYQFDPTLRSDHLFHDCGFAIIEMNNGTQVTLHTTRYANQNGYIEEYVAMNNTREEIVALRYNDRNVFREVQGVQCPLTPTPGWAEIHKEGMVKRMDHFLNIIEGFERPNVGKERNLMVARTIDAVLESVSTGQNVKI